MNKYITSVEVELEIASSRLVFSSTLSNYIHVYMTQRILKKFVSNLGKNLAKPKRIDEK